MPRALLLLLLALPGGCATLVAPAPADDAARRTVETWLERYRDTTALPAATVRERLDALPPPGAGCSVARMERVLLLLHGAAPTPDAATGRALTAPCRARAGGLGDLAALLDDFLATRAAAARTTRDLDEVRDQLEAIKAIEQRLIRQEHGAP